MKTLTLILLGSALLLSHANGENIAVYFQGPNTNGIPTNWPSYLRNVGTNLVATGSDLVATNMAQVDALKVPLQGAYNSAVTAIYSNQAVAYVAALRTNEIENAVLSIGDTNMLARIQRAVALLTLSEINTLRTNAAINLPARTTNQFLTALTNAIRGDPK